MGPSSTCSMCAGGDGWGCCFPPERPPGSWFLGRIADGGYMAVSCCFFGGHDRRFSTSLHNQSLETRARTHQTAQPVSSTGFSCCLASTAYGVIGTSLISQSVALKPTCVLSSCLQDMRMFHQDRSRLNRENVVLTREINDLRRKAKALALQQNGVERVRCVGRGIVSCRVV